MVRYEDITVVIPTLNEQKTIGKLITRLLVLYNGANILVVDDGSTDDTQKIVLRFAKAGKHVRLLDRHRSGKPPGLTYSMIDGLMHSSTKYTMFIDGDLQHPPEIIKSIVESLRSGDTIAIAVRGRNYNPILYRRIISMMSIAFGNAILYISGKASSSDIMSGYFGIETEYAVKTVKENRHRFIGDGYKFLFDILKCTSRSSARISEVQYRFKERMYGSSKASMRQGIALLQSYFS
jgi:dolichol-phosphate mannosyltransferase